MKTGILLTIIDLNHEVHFHPSDQNIEIYKLDRTPSHWPIVYPASMHSWQNVKYLCATWRSQRIPAASNSAPRIVDLLDEEILALQAAYYEIFGDNIGFLDAGSLLRSIHELAVVEDSMGVVILSYKDLELYNSDVVLNINRVVDFKKIIMRKNYFDGKRIIS